MIRPCTDADIAGMERIINDAARAYRGAVAPDLLHDPYMPRAEIESEIRAGVRFWGYEDGGQLLGVMGLQDVKDATLIRHAYVASDRQRHGIGGALMDRLAGSARGRLMVGTWAAAYWAIGFYERHGFRRVDAQEKDRLLDTYWTITPRQRDASVVLVHSGPRQGRL